MAPKTPSLDESPCDVVHIGESKPATSNSDRSEIRLFLELAIPTTLLNLSFTISPLLTASYVGRKFGSVYLSGFTLANLTGNLCTFSLLAGLFSAADTLSPQAFGAGHYKEVGLHAMRGFFASMVLLIPINILLVCFLESTLIAIGEDPEAAFHASQWYRIFALALPFSVVYNAVWKFLSAQHVMRPLIIVSLISCGIILPVALEFFTDKFGFLGSALAYVCFQASEAILILLYLWWKRPHIASTWPGLRCWRDALKYEPMMEYLYLGAGGMFAQSEWIYWEALGLIIGRLGVLPLSVHTIPNQVIMTMCMAPFAIGIALAIRMGVTITRSVRHAKKIVTATLLLSTLVFGVASVILYFQSERVFAIFTKEEEIIAQAQSIWLKVCIFNFNVAIFGVNSGISTGLGMQWTLGAINFVFLWVFGLPVTYYFALIRGGGLDAAWTWINVPYTCMNASLLAVFVSTNWHAVKDKNQERKTKNISMELDSQQLLTRGILGERTGLLNDAFKSDYGYFS
jgi:MATE family multidrug resistance protein